MTKGNVILMKRTKKKMKQQKSNCNDIEEPPNHSENTTNTNSETEKLEIFINDEYGNWCGIFEPKDEDEYKEIKKFFKKRGYEIYGGGTTKRLIGDCRKRAGRKSPALEEETNLIEKSNVL